ncbi:MAG: hypothetical protein ACOC7V_10760 [Spirochaetota bacterium]
MNADMVALEKLNAELQLDIERLAELRSANERAARRVAVGNPDELEYAALGYTIHNIFNLIENYATRIARTFENAIDPASWHRELIERMQLSIAGVRPALWDRNLAGRIDELRRFRHVFRNMYANDLDPKRVAAVQDGVPATLTLFCAAHDRFTADLAAMIRAREDETLNDR